MKDSQNLVQTDGIDLVTFGQRLRHLRRMRGLTLTELGERVDRAPSVLSLIENGRREPKLSLIEQLATALSVPTTELLSRQPPSRRAQLEIALADAQHRYDDVIGGAAPNVHRQLAALCRSVSVEQLWAVWPRRGDAASSIGSVNGSSILLVEDDEDIGSELVQALTSHGHRARLARSAVADLQLRQNSLQLFACNLLF